MEMVVDLSDIPNKKLIKMVKDNPNELSYTAELLGRFETGDITGEEALMFFEVRMLGGD